MKLPCFEDGFQTSVLINVLCKLKYVQDEMYLCARDIKQMHQWKLTEVEGEGGTEVEAEGGKPGQFYRPVTEVWAEIKFYLRTKFTADPST